MANILAILFLLAQTFPPLPSPTPWSTPTPLATVDDFITDSEDLMATAQTDQYTFEADGDDIEFEGQSIVPELETADSILLFSYIKWLVSSGSEAVFGPFSPLLIPLGILLTLAFISLLVYFWENVIVTVLKFVGFIISSILRLFGR